MNEVWSCERGRRVNLVRCDTFYFELLIDILMEQYTQPNTASHDSVIRNSWDIIDNK